MAPGSRQRQQQHSRQQQQQQQSSLAPNAEQAHQLLQRLATAPDLTLFRDKHDRVQQLALCRSLPASEELLLLLAASVTNGLRQLQSLLLQLDLPKNASLSIHNLLVTYCTYSLLLMRQSVSESRPDTEPSTEWVQQQQLVQQVADTGRHQLQLPS
jgi:hypothetical protein